MMKVYLTIFFILFPPQYIHSADIIHRVSYDSVSVFLYVPVLKSYSRSENPMHNVDLTL